MRDERATRVWLRGGAGPMRDRRAARGGARNESRDWADETADELGAGQGSSTPAGHGETLPGAPVSAQGLSPGADTEDMGCLSELCCVWDWHFPTAPWPTNEVDLGGRTFRVLAFYPAQLVHGVADDGVRRRLQTRAGEGTLVLEGEDGGYTLKVDLDGALDHRHLRRRAR